MRALATVILVLAAHGCGRRSVEIRADRPDARVVVSAAPVPRATFDLDAALAHAFAEARKGDWQASLLWYRGSCVDTKGAFHQTCGGKTWSGTIVFGMPSPGFIPVTGFFSAQFRRLRPGAEDMFGVSILGADVHTQVLAGPAGPEVRAPRCSFARAVERAPAQGFSTDRPFKIVFEAGTKDWASSFTFIREDEQKRIDDDC